MIKLENSQFSPCSVSWNSGKNQFQKNTKDEVYLCCNKKCDEYRTRCNELCENKTVDCRTECNVMGNVCDKICQTSRFDKEEIFLDPCLKNSGCLKGEILETKCLVDKKDELINCCLSNCSPSPDLNCEQHCAISYDLGLQHSNQGKEEIITRDTVTKSLNKNKKNNLCIYLLVISIFLVLILILILIFRSK